MSTGYAILKDRLEPYTGDIDSWYGVDLNTIGDKLIVDGVKYLIGLVESQQPEMLQTFSTRYTSDVSGDTNGWTDWAYDLEMTEKLLSVIRADYECKEVPVTFEKRVQDSGSLYYATVKSPVYTRRGQKLYVYPASGIVSVDAIVFDEAINISSDYDLANCPKELYQIPLLYTAKFLLLYKMTLLQAKLPELSDSSDGTYAEASASSQGFEKIRDYIENEEDSELAQIKLQAITGENQSLNQEYQWLQGQLQVIMQELENQAQILIGVEPRGYSPSALQERSGG